MVARVRDLERNAPFNKMVSFSDAAAGGSSVMMLWRTSGSLGSDGFNIGRLDPDTEQNFPISNIEDVNDIAGNAWYLNIGSSAPAFFDDLNASDTITLSFPAGTAAVTLARDGGRTSLKLSAGSTTATGAIHEDDAVVITSGSGSENIEAWFRVDDSTIADFAANAVQTDTRRVIFIRTRADDRITVDHKATIGGLTYEVKSIQELATRGELRIALVRIDQGLADVVLGGR